MILVLTMLVYCSGSCAMTLVCDIGFNDVGLLLTGSCVMTLVCDIGFNDVGLLFRIVCYDISL